MKAKFPRLDQHLALLRLLVANFLVFGPGSVLGFVSAWEGSLFCSLSDLFLDSFFWMVICGRLIIIELQSSSVLNFVVF